MLIRIEWQYLRCLNFDIRWKNAGNQEYGCCRREIKTFDVVQAFPSQIPLHFNRFNWEKNTTWPVAILRGRGQKGPMQPIILAGPSLASHFTKTFLSLKKIMKRISLWFDKIWSSGLFPRRFLFHLTFILLHSNLRRSGKMKTHAETSLAVTISLTTFSLQISK